MSSATAELRQCRACGESYPATREFFYVAGWRKDGSARLYRQCKWCQNARRGQYPRGRAGAPSVLPSRPLVEAVQAVAHRETYANPWARPNGGDSGLGIVVLRAGIPARTWREWESGHRPMAQLDTADRVLTRLGLLWFDVWPPEDYPEVAQAWEG